MRAAILERADGDPSSVVVRDVPRPRPARGQVLVAMQAAPVNPSDLNYLDGAYAAYLADTSWNLVGRPLAFDPAGARLHPSPPFVLGGEGTGRVVEAGASLLARRLVGKRVALTGSPVGLYQEFAVVDAMRAVVLPESLDEGAAATLFVNPLTALALVEHVLRPKKGHHVLVTAAGGALAAMVRRLCEARGASTIDVVRSEAGRARLAQAGARHVFVAGPDLPRRVAELTRGEGAMGAIDCVGGDTADLAMRCLGRYGTLVVYGTLGREPMPLESRALMMRGGRIVGFFLPHFLDRRNPLELLRLVRRARAMAEAGETRVTVRSTYAIEDVRAALADARAGGDGKVLLRLGGGASH